MKAETKQFLADHRTEVMAALESAKYFTRNNWNVRHQDAVVLLTELGRLTRMEEISLPIILGERDLALEQMAAAPHQYMVCQTFNDGDCTCWKAEVDPA